MGKETIEEAAKEFVLSHDFSLITTQNHLANRCFQDGAKWQQERSYSEKEVLELLKKALTHQDNGEIGNLVTAQGKIRPANFFSWFEQFRKKI